MERSEVERLLRKQIAEDTGRPLSSHARMSERSVESYLRAGVKPRWMERIGEIDRAMRRERAELERSYRALRHELAGDPEGFAEVWTGFAQRRDFSALNELITQHNEWYPIERDLPMDPRTGEYVRILGRSHVRPLLGAAWVLEQFPAR